MDDEQILERGGTQRDIEEYAKQNGADLTEADFESSKEEPIKEVEDKAREEGRREAKREAQIEVLTEIFQTCYQEDSRTLELVEERLQDLRDI